MRTPHRSLLLVAPLFATLVSCSSSSTATSDSAVAETVAASAAAKDETSFSIVTTVSPITSIASAIAGTAAKVTGIVPEGTNSHTFEPSPSLAATLSKADVVYINGLQLEEPTKKLAEANMSKEAELVELGTLTLPENEYIYDFSFPKEEGKPNPHLWTNPLLAKKYAELIRDDLTKRLPAKSDLFASNYTAFAAKADLLSEAVKAATATVPADQRKLLTYHDSFPYFARDFGWTVVGAIQPADFEDPTPRDVAQLIDQVKKEKVKTIFGSEVFPSPVLEQIGKETGAAYVDTLRDDDLPGAPGDPEHSYLGLMRTDFVTMVKALGGDSKPLEALDLSLPNPDTAEYAQ